MSLLQRASILTERQLSAELAAAERAAEAVRFTIVDPLESDTVRLAQGARLALAEVKVTLFRMLNTGGLPLTTRRSITAALIETENRVTYAAIRALVAEASPGKST